MALDPGRIVVAGQDGGGRALAAQAVEQPRIVRLVDPDLDRRRVVQGHVVVPDGDVARPVQVVVAELRLQDVFLEAVQKGAGGLRRHAIDLDRRADARPGGPDRAVQRPDAGARVRAHEFRQPAFVARVQAAADPERLEPRLFFRRQGGKRGRSIGKGGLPVQRQAFAKRHELVIGTGMVGGRARFGRRFDPLPVGRLARHRHVMDKEHRHIDGQGLVFDVGVPGAAVLQGGRVALAIAEQVRGNQHRRRLVRQAFDLSGQRGVGGGNLALRIGPPGDGAVAGAVLLRRLAAAQEVRGMRDRRAPVIREAFERREREPAEVLSGKRHQPAMAERIQQEFHLRRTQGVAEVDAGDARAHAAGGKRALDRDLPAERGREPVFQILRRGIQRKLLHVGPSPVGKASVQRRRVCPTMGHIST